MLFLCSKCCSQSLIQFFPVTSPCHCARCFTWKKTPSVAMATVCFPAFAQFQFQGLILRNASFLAIATSGMVWPRIWIFPHPILSPNGLVFDFPWGAFISNDMPGVWRIARKAQLFFHPVEPRLVAENGVTEGLIFFVFQCSKGVLRSLRFGNIFHRHATGPSAEVLWRSRVGQFHCCHRALWSSVVKDTGPPTYGFGESAPKNSGVAIASSDWQTKVAGRLVSGCRWDLAICISRSGTKRLSMGRQVID